MVVQVCELAIHSANREVTDDNRRTVNNYTWPIGRTLKNVESIEVLYAEIPNSYYNIPEGDNTFVYTVYDTEYVITIPPGNYHADDIVVRLNALLAAEPTPVNNISGYTNMAEFFTFTLDDITGMLGVIQNTQGAIPGGVSKFPYGLGWLNDTRWDALVTGDTYSAGGVLRLGAEAVLYLSIPETSHHGSKYIFGSSSVPIETDKVVTRFSVHAGLNHMAFFSNERNMHERHFDPHPPIHLSKLTVRFLRPDGRLVDFNSYDHSLHIQVVYND